MKNRNKKRITWIIGTILALCINYFLCRYIFFELHGMIDWPFVLFVFGLIAIMISSIFDARKVMICTVLGYIIGFAVGMIFNVDGLDPGGGRTSNNWYLWMNAMLIVMLIGVIWEIASKILQKKRKT